MKKCCRCKQPFNEWFLWEVKDHKWKKLCLNCHEVYQQLYPRCKCCNRATSPEMESIFGGYCPECS